MSECFICKDSETILCTACSTTYSCTAHLKSLRPGEQCLPFYIGYHEDKGRIIIASRNIKAGELVLIDEPLLQGPGGKTPATCLDCLATWSFQAQGYTCSTCQWPVCSKQCELGKWHQIECKYLSDLDLKPNLDKDICDEYSAIFALRVCISSNKPEIRKNLDLLMGHEDVLEKDSNWKTGLDIVEKVGDFAYSGVRGAGIIATNAVAMPHRHGRWLFPTFSFLSHSCVSNARFFPSSGERILVRAQVAIPEGEEITISYVEPGMGSVLRKEYIEQKWYFKCACPMCQDPTELNTYLSGMKCRFCKEGTMLQITDDEKWDCNVCKERMDNSTMLVLIKTLYAKAKEVKSRLEIDECLENFSKVLHPNNFINLHLKEKWLGEKCVTREELEKGLMFMSEVMNLRKIMEPGLTLSLGQNLKTLNQIMMDLGKMKLSSGEIEKQEFMKMVLGAANNMKIARKCFED